MITGWFIQNGKRVNAMVLDAVGGRLWVEDMTDYTRHFIVEHEQFHYTSTRSA